MKKLYENDDFYRTSRYTWVRPEDAKKLYIYGCARHVIKSTMLLMLYEDLLQEKPKAADMNHIGRMVPEAFIDTQNVIIRRHTELLVNLINFSTTNQGEAYRTFSSAENLDIFLAEQFDLNTFFEFKSDNKQHSIDHFAARIREDLKTLGLQNIWFLKPKWEDAVGNLQNPFASIRRRYMTALEKATDDERLIIGKSYRDVFVDVNPSAHASVSTRTSPHHRSFKAIRKNFSQISMLGMHIINRANSLMGFDDTEDIIRIAEEKGTSNATALLTSSRRIFQRGDLVLAGNDLAQVIECKMSKYGYTACKIRYLDKPPLPDTPEDWLPSKFVISLLPKSQVRHFLFQKKNNPDTPEELKGVLNMMEKESDDVLMDASCKAFLHMHQQGILFHALLQGGSIQLRDDLDDE